MDKVLILNTYNSIKPISNQEPKTLNIKIVSKKLSSIPKEALVSTFLVANAFVWYLSGFSYLQAATTSHFVGNSLLLIEVINFASLVSSAFIISSVTNRFKSRRFFLKYWVLAGVLLSFLFVVGEFRRLCQFTIFGNHNWGLFRNWHAHLYGIFRKNNCIPKPR